MMKYRARTKSGRVIGPIKKDQLHELFIRGEIDETCEFQEFPIGDWEKFSAIPALKGIEIKDIPKVAPKEVEKPPISPPSQEEPRPKKVISNQEDTQFREFKFDRDEEDLGIDYEAIDKKIEEEKKEANKTRVIKRPAITNIDKTTIVSRSTLEDDEVKEDSSKEKEEDSKEEKEKEKEVVKIDVEQKTVMFNIEALKEEAQEVNNIEEDVFEIEEKLRDVEFQSRVKEKQKKKKKKEKQTVIANIVTGENKKRNLSFFLFLIVALIFLMPEDDNKIDKVISPALIFPVVVEGGSAQRAKTLYEKGREVYAKGGYLNRILAAKLFKESLEQSFRNNKSLAYLVLLYSEILPEAKNKLESGNTIFKLISIARADLLNDPVLALGAANFYSYFDKEATAIYIIETYLRLNPPTPKLYAKYLNLLIEVGNFVDAKTVFEKLLSAKRKKLPVINALNNYYISNEKLDEAVKLTKQSYKDLKDNYDFLVTYGDILLKIEDLKNLDKIAKFIINNKGGGSPYIYSQGLKYMGYIEAFKGNTKNVASLFNKSLELYDSQELKDVLSSLEISGGDLTQDIITKSKVDVLIRKADQARKSLNWNKAFQYAIDANDLEPQNIKSNLFLANLQSRRGYFNSAISTLKKLREYHPTNNKINFELIMANIRAYKLDEVKRLISTMSTIPSFKNSFEYLAALGFYYKMIGNEKLSFERFKGALQKNPLRDDLYFEMAKIAFSVRRYKKCKEYLGEASKLDPYNVEYKLLFAKVLYETDDVQTAIGYLRNELEQMPDNPKMIGQIAIFYYKDQSYTEFKEYRERLERLNTKDESLYKYLVRTSELENNINLVIDNGERLLLINPGDLEVRMSVANAYTKKRNFQKALRELNEVENRLSSYPKVNFYKAQIYRTIKDYKSAEEAAKKEIERNPNSEFGYYILGQIYLDTQDFAQAKKMLEKSIQIKPDYYDCLLALGWLKFKQSYFAAARELYIRALRQNETDPEIHKRLGYVYKEIGQSQMAIEKFRTYLNLNPGARDRAQIERVIRQLK